MECERSLHLSPNKNFLKFEGIGDLKLQLKFKELSNSFKRQLICVAPKYFQNLILKEELKDLSEIEIYVIHEQKPYIKNRVELDNLSDPYGTPKVKLNWDFPKENFLIINRGVVASICFQNTFEIKDRILKSFFQTPVGLGFSFLWHGYWQYPPEFNH